MVLAVRPFSVLVRAGRRPAAHRQLSSPSEFLWPYQPNPKPLEHFAEFAQMAKAFSLLPPSPPPGARVVVLDPDAGLSNGLYERALLSAARKCS